MIEMKIWVNKVKETTKTLEYKNSGNINIDINEKTKDWLLIGTLIFNYVIYLVLIAIYYWF